jgi:hypothetical protein
MLKNWKPVKYRRFQFKYNPNTKCQLELNSWDHQFLINFTKTVEHF